MFRQPTVSRSANMRAIKSKDTSPEMKVRRLLHLLRYRYRLHRNDLPGRPDIIFSSRKKLILVHGCFWHQHKKKNCPLAHKPKSNLEYWLPKLERNIKRDKKNLKELKKLGWSVLTIWECETKKEKPLANKLNHFLKAE